MLKEENAIVIQKDKTRRFDSRDLNSLFDVLKASKDHIFKHIVEHCFKSSTLMRLIEDFILKSAQANELLHRILKVNSIWHVFDLNQLLNKRKQTLLHLAVAKRDDKTAQLVCSYGANLDLKDGEGETAMQLALRMSNKECVKVLIDYGSCSSSAIQHCSQKYLREMEKFLTELVKSKTKTNDQDTIRNLVFQGNT